MESIAPLSAYYKVNPRIQNWRAVIAGHGGWVCLLCLLLGTGTGLVGTAWEAVAAEPMLGAQERYLEKTTGHATRLLVSIGILKGGLDVVEGSTLFGIEVGDVAQPFLDTLDIAWDLVVVSTLSLLCLRMLLPAAFPLGEIVLCVGLGAWLGERLLARFAPRSGFRSPARSLAGGTLFLVAFLWLILPLSFLATAQLERTITEPVVRVYGSELAAIARDLEAPSAVSRVDLSDAAIQDDIGPSHWFTPLQRIVRMAQELVSASLQEADRLRIRATRVRDFLADERGGERLGTVVLQIAVVALLRGILFPAATVLLLVWVVRRGFRRLAGPSAGRRAE